jgi:hypothetical protein
MKKLMLPLVVSVMAIALALSVASLARADTDNSSNNSSIVGVWSVDADAPYRPHLFTFYSDGTMLSTNPTNVQENPAAPHGGTNDSVGMGVWRVEKNKNERVVVGTFKELNAFADNHQPTDTLSVSFKVKLSNDANSFDGPASATLGADTFPSHLTGTRVVLDKAAVNALP